MHFFTLGNTLDMYLSVYSMTLFVALLCEASWLPSVFLTLPKHRVQDMGVRLRTADVVLCPRSTTLSSRSLRLRTWARLNPSYFLFSPLVNFFAIRKTRHRTRCRAGIDGNVVQRHRSALQAGRSPVDLGVAVPKPVTSVVWVEWCRKVDVTR